MEWQDQIAAQCPGYSLYALDNLVHIDIIDGGSITAYDVFLDFWR